MKTLTINELISVRWELHEELNATARRESLVYRTVVELLYRKLSDLGTIDPSYRPERDNAKAEVAELSS